MSRLQTALVRWLGLKEPAEEATGALANEQLGSIAVRLALYPQEWIERRVEGVQFMDDTTVRQRVSVTLRHPQPGFFSDAARPNEGQLIYVPLALLSKRTLRKLDVAYEDGATFAVPATARNGELTSLGLSEAVWGYSETRRRAGLSARSLEVLDLLVRAPRDKAEPLLDIIKDADEELGQVLMEPNEFRGLTFDLAENFMLLAPVTYEAGVERVVKYSYSLPLPWKLSVRNLTAYLGLTDFAQQLTDLPIGFGASYHVAIDAPDDVRLTRGRLYGSYVGSEGKRRITVGIAEDGDNPTIDLHARRPREAVLTAAQNFGRLPWFKRLLRLKRPIAEDPSDALQAVRAHRPTDVQRSDRGFADVHFRPRVAAVAPLTATSVLAAVGLLFVRPRLDEVDDQTISAVLLALPIATASFLARPGEHAIAARLLRGFRITAVLVGVCALFVAAILGLGFVDKPAASAFDCRPARGPNAVRSQRVCTPLEQRRPQISESVQLTADVATALAAGIAALMFAGSVRIGLAPTTHQERAHYASSGGGRTSSRRRRSV